MVRATRRDDLGTDRIVDGVSYDGHTSNYLDRGMSMDKDENQHSDGWRWLRLQQLNRNSANVEYVNEILNGRLPEVEVVHYPSI